jgi:hypothetical protein
MQNMLQGIWYLNPNYYNFFKWLPWKRVPSAKRNQ